MSLLIAYAASFSSFLVANLKAEQLAKIKAVILFGSVARGEAAQESDVDLFIDVVADEKKLASETDAILRKFYGSIIFTKYWKLLGVENEIKPIVGKLSDWRDLKSSILANGITLYGKFIAKAEKAQPAVLFYWGTIANQPKRVLLSKRLYGYKYKDKTYRGLLEIYGGQKISTNCIFVGLEQASTFSRLFRQMKISVRMMHLARV